MTICCGTASSILETARGDVSLTPAVLQEHPRRRAGADTIAMSLSDENIRLVPLVPTSAPTPAGLTMAWHELLPRTVETIAANLAGLWSFFADDRCLYLATIERIVQTSAPDEQEDPFAELLGPTEFNPHYVAVGIIYLAVADIPGTVNIGLALCPAARRQGVGARAASLLTGWAFQELGAHRVQARIVRPSASATSTASGPDTGDGGDDLECADAALQFFGTLGFAREGTARRALFCPAEDALPACLTRGATNGEWRDVVTLALLDTDWAMRQGLPPVPRGTGGGVKGLWDALFVRHERETQEMLALEERTEKRRGRARRTNGEIERAEGRAEAEGGPSGAVQYSYGTSTGHKVDDTWMWESDESGAETPTRSMSRSSTPSVSSASVSEYASPPLIPSSPAQSPSRPQWSQLFSTPYHSGVFPTFGSAESETLREGEQTLVDDDAESTVESFSSVEREDISDEELLSDAESVPRSASVVSVASASSFDSWDALSDDFEDEEDSEENPLLSATR